jgi:hypothetical protein
MIFVAATARTVAYCGWWLPVTAGIPLPGMSVQVMEYRQPVFFS